MKHNQIYISIYNFNDRYIILNIQVYNQNFMLEFNSVFGAGVELILIPYTIFAKFHLHQESKLVFAT